MRPAHLIRRGATYTVRFRIPSDLAKRTGLAELRKSLHTSDYGIARRRCLKATVWFRAEVERLRRMTSPTRQDLEAAAKRFFEELASDLDHPRELDAQDVDQLLEHAQDYIGVLDAELVSNTFRWEVEMALVRMLGQEGIDAGSLGEPQRIRALSLVARAVREQQRMLVHQLTTPASPFIPEDTLFVPDQPVVVREPIATVVRVAPRPYPSGHSLGGSVTAYLGRKKAQGVGQSQHDEIKRALNWLEEAVGSDTPLETVSKDELRRFRDDLARLDISLPRRKAPFRDRLTNVAANQIKSVTALRYWKSVQAFWDWCASEGLRDDDPAAGLRLMVRKGEQPRKTEPFSEAELRKLFTTPLYAGYLSAKRLMHSGQRRVREGHWWAGVLSLHTGLRAGELSQLGPDDFVFDAPVPHLKVREEDDSGNRVKSTKTASSTRDVPLLPILLELGLRQFVDAQAHRHPKDRVFRVFRLGSGDRLSDGMTRFWGDLLKKYGLWKPGRATHVFRHSVTDNLRARGVIDEDIGAVLGHSGKTQTAGYGGAQPLERKLKTLAQLDYGLDMLDLLGGPYDPSVHTP